VLLAENLVASATDDDLLAGLPQSERHWAISEGAVPFRHVVDIGYDLLTVDQVMIFQIFFNSSLRFRISTEVGNRHYHFSK
jgi:hypothetical protein